MRADEFIQKDDNIAFMKFMLDKTWLAIRRKAKKQAEIAKNIEDLAHQKKKNQPLTKRIRDTDFNNYNTGRIKRGDEPKLY